MEELTGDLSWPDLEAEHANRRRTKNEEPAADRYGNPLVPQDFGNDGFNEEAEAEMAELYDRVFATPVDGLRPEWQRTFELSVVRDGERKPQVERGTYAPVLLSLREVSSWLAAEGMTVMRGVNRGRPYLPNQVQEQKLRVGISKMVAYFFRDHPDELQAYLEKRKESGERYIQPDELLQRFTEGVIRLFRGQNNGRHRE